MVLERIAVVTWEFNQQHGGVFQKCTFNFAQTGKVCRGFQAA